MLSKNYVYKNVFVNFIILKMDKIFRIKNKVEGVKTIFIKNICSK